MNQELEARVAKLERSVSLWRRLGGASALAIAILVTCGLASPEDKEVKASAFTLVDGNGIRRGGLSFTVSGMPYFDLADSRGKRRLMLTVKDGEGPAILLTDFKGAPRVSISTYKDDFGVMMLSKGTGLAIGSVRERDGTLCVQALKEDLSVAYQWPK